MTQHSKATAAQSTRGKKRIPSDDGKSLELALLAVNAVVEKKGLNPVLLDVRGLVSYTDYILVVSGRSDRQVLAIADGIKQELSAKGMRSLGIEGDSRGQWTLVDFGDVVIHVFHHPVREVFDLEGLWIDAPRVELDLPPDVKLPPHEMY